MPPRVPRVVGVSDEELAAQKAAKAARCQQFEVTGDRRIRDAISRELVEPGGIVNIDPDETVILLNVRAGLMKPVAAAEAAPAETVKAKAGKGA